MRYLGAGLQGLLARAMHKPCVLCGSEPVYAAAYVAQGEAAERLGAKPGSARMIFYSLCDGHPQSADTAERAEKLLEAFLAANPPLIVPQAVITDDIALFEAE